MKDYVTIYRNGNELTEGPEYRRIFATIPDHLQTFLKAANDLGGAAGQTNMPKLTIALTYVRDNRLENPFYWSILIVLKAGRKPMFVNKRSQAPDEYQSLKDVFDELMYNMMINGFVRAIETQPKNPTI